MATWSSIPRQRGAPALLGQNVAAHSAPFSPVQPLQFRQAPLLFAAVAFVSGITLRHLWRLPSTLVLATALLLLCAIMAAWRSPRLILPALAALWIVLGWTCAELRPQLVPSAAVLTYADGLRRDVTGTVTDVEPLKPAPLQRNEDPLRWSEIRPDAEIDSATASGETADLQLSQIEQVTPDTATMVPMTRWTSPHASYCTRAPLRRPRSRHNQVGPAALLPGPRRVAVSGVPGTGRHLCHGYRKAR